jgi:hypothetical protein
MRSYLAAAHLVKRVVPVRQGNPQFVVPLDSSVVQGPLTA